MTWLISLFVALLSGVAGFFLARLIAKACVLWHDLSYSDGASGLLAGYLGLVGGLAGLIIGFLSARVVVLFYGPGFEKELATSLGVVLLIAGVSTLLCRLYADIPPTIGGRELNLEVEFRFPNTLSPDHPPTARGNDWVMTLDSYSGQRRRKGLRGSILTETARYENGQWIVPTQVRLFTERGRREVMLHRLHSKELTRFHLPLPRRPGRKFEEWSSWIPQHKANGQSSPAETMSCRFRVQKEPWPQTPPPPTNPEAP